MDTSGRGNAPKFDFSSLGAHPQTTVDAANRIPYALPEPFSETPAIPAGVFVWLYLRWQREADQLIDQLGGDHRANMIVEQR